MDGYPHVKFSSGLRKTVYGIQFSQPVDESPFPHLLDGGHRTYLGFYGYRIHDEVTLHRYPFLPWNALDVLKDIFKLQSFELSHFYLYPVS